MSAFLILRQGCEESEILHNRQKINSLLINPYESSGPIIKGPCDKF
jgi:hypothetical protein